MEINHPKLAWGSPVTMENPYPILWRINNFLPRPALLILSFVYPSHIPVHVPINW